TPGPRGRRRSLRSSIRFDLLVAGQLTHHEAHSGVTSEGGGLENTLHDQRGDALVDLENDVPGEVDAGLELLPELALVLQDGVELVDLLQLTSVNDGAGAAGRNAVDEDLRA